MIGWAVETAIAVSVLILLILVVRSPFAAAFGARAAYALWLAPALRAIAPPLSLPSVPVPPSALGAADYLLITSGASEGSSISLGSIAAFIWIVGAAIFLALHLTRHHRFLRGALSAGHALDIPDVPYDVIASDRVSGPMATGLVHPLILVPADFEQRMNAEERRFALWHEQLHHRRGDIWASAGALILVSLLWFNPFAHLALGAFRRDMEAACDARLLAEAGPTAAPAYAATILRCAAAPVPRSLCALTAIDELKGRLTMLKSSHGKYRRIAGLALASAIAVAGVATASAAQEAAKDEKQIVEKKVIIRHADGDKNTAELDALSPDMRAKIEKCEGKPLEAEVQGGTADKKQHTRIILCAKGDGPQAAEGLEKALKRIESDSDISPETKAELLAQLRAKIAEMRAR
jgi:beta-lactamase regulating signal transducer with metallopeptidase domain